MAKTGGGHYGLGNSGGKKTVKNGQKTVKNGQKTVKTVKNGQKTVKNGQKRSKNGQKTVISLMTVFPPVVAQF